MFISLKPLAERDGAGAIVTRLRPRLAKIAGAERLHRPGAGRARRRPAGHRRLPVHAAKRRPERAAASGRVRLQNALHDACRRSPTWRATRRRAACRRAWSSTARTAARMGVTTDLIDSTLGNAFGQSIVSTIYTERNQYRVIMEVDPRYSQGPEALKDVFLRTAGRRAGAARRGGALRVHQHAALGEPPGPVRRFDDLLQPARGRVALAGAVAAIQRRWRASACR